jgi:Fic family protein
MLPFRQTELRSALTDIDELRAALDARAPLVFGWEGLLRRDLEAGAVQASVAIEGIPVTVEEVRRILAGDPPPTVTPENADLVRGYREAMRYVQSRADDPVFEWSAELLKSIHSQVMAGGRAGGRYGEGRFLRDKATGDIVYTPPQEHVERLVDELCDRMNSWKSHPALRAAWAHVAFAAVHPFADGNGRTARILASLAMYRGGFKRPEFCSLEEWWGNHRRAYYEAFTCLGLRFDARADVTPFITAHVDAQRSQVRALALTEDTNRHVWAALSRICEQVGIPDRAAFALWDAYNGREITRSYYRAITDTKDTAATTDFASLTAAGLLRAEGETRGRRYLAGSRLLALIAEELGIPVTEATERGAIIEKVAQRLAGARKTLGPY